MSHCPRPSGTAGCRFSISLLSTWMLIHLRLELAHQSWWVFVTQRKIWGLIVANPLWMIGSCFYFSWGNNIYPFRPTLAQDTVRTLLQPDCRRGVCCHHVQLHVGRRQGEAADWPWCQVPLVAQQPRASCTLLRQLSAAPQLCLRPPSAGGNLGWSSFFRIRADPKASGRPELERKVL